MKSMLRINRQKSNTPKAKVREHCANYEAGVICSGCMITDKLQQWIDVSKSGKKCLIVNGDKCDYYDQCVKPMVKS